MNPSTIYLDLASELHLKKVFIYNNGEISVTAIGLVYRSGCLNTLAILPTLRLLQAQVYPRKRSFEMDRSMTPIDLEFVFCLRNPKQGEEVEKLRIFLGRVTNASRPRISSFKVPV